jgi:hypothetical protein
LKKGKQMLMLLLLTLLLFSALADTHTHTPTNPAFHPIFVPQGLSKGFSQTVRCLQKTE